MPDFRQFSAKYSSQNVEVNQRQNNQLNYWFHFHRTKSRTDFSLLPLVLLLHWIRIHNSFSTHEKQIIAKNSYNTLRHNSTHYIFYVPHSTFTWWDLHVIQTNSLSDILYTVLGAHTTFHNPFKLSWRWRTWRMNNILFRTTFPEWKNPWYFSLFFNAKNVSKKKIATALRNEKYKCRVVALEIKQSKLSSLQSNADHGVNE